MGTTYSGHHKGLVLTAGFHAHNPVTIAADGVITGTTAYNGDAVYAANFPWTITNLGTVGGHGAQSYGIVLTQPGTIVNGASGSNAAVIEGGAGGVYLAAAAAVINFGTIGAAAGAASAVKFAASGGLANYGTILGAVSVAGSYGIVTNGSASAGTAALISGGVVADRVQNLGAVENTAAGGIGVTAALLANGIDLDNEGGRAPGALIAGYAVGAEVVAESTGYTLHPAINSGTIEATGSLGIGLEAWQPRSRSRTDTAAPTPA
jgi:hypothetical protein